MAVSVGISIGYGVNALFGGVDFRLFGFWHITQSNVVSLISGIVGILLFVVCYFKVTNISMDYEELQRQFGRKLKADNQDSVKQSNEFNWRELLTFDLFLISFSSAVMRFSLSSTFLVLVMIVVHMFGWSSETLSVVTLTSATLTYISVFISVKLEIYQGRARTFFIYILCICSITLLLNIIVVERIITVPTFAAQVVVTFMLNMMFSWVYFLSLTIGKLLVVYTVPVNYSSLAAGFRNSVCNFVKAFAYFTSFLSYEYTGYIFPCVNFILFIFAWILLARRRTYIYNRP